MKRQIHFYLFWVSVILVISACGGRISQQQDESGTTITLESMSNQVGETTLMVSVMDSQGNPINDAMVSAKGDMTHAGMVPVLAEVSSGENGIYQVPFEWTMGGDWFVTVEATLVDGTVITERFDGISISGDMGDMEGMDHGDGDMEGMDHGDGDVEN